MNSSRSLAAAPDAESAEWIAGLTGMAAERPLHEARLHALLVSVATHELRRRADSAPWLAGVELEDLAHQAAADAMLAILRKLDTFRGESRFTTWAYRFVVLEVSSKLGRHHRQVRPENSLEAESWARLPDRFGVDPAEHAQRAELVEAIRRAVDEALTAHQRRMFSAIVLDAIPLDTLAERLSMNRNAIYKTVFDARRKIRGYLVASGHLDEEGTHGP